MLKRTSNATRPKCELSFRTGASIRTVRRRRIREQTWWSLAPSRCVATVRFAALFIAAVLVACAWPLAANAEASEEPPLAEVAESPKEADTDAKAQVQPPARESSPFTPAPPTAAVDEPAIKPRAELRIPSVKKLHAELVRSRSCAFVAFAHQLILQMLGDASDGVSKDEVLAIAEQARMWSDTSVSLVTFASDTQGRARWAVRLDWSLKELAARAQQVLSTDAAKDLFRGIKFHARDEGGYEIRLPDATLAFLLPIGGSQSVIASHTDVTVPAELLREELTNDQPRAIAARLNLAATEKDSGASFLSDFAMLTAVTYAGGVNPEGEWVEQIRVEWPPIAGMGAKVVLGRVRHTFFVPDSALLAVAANSAMAPPILEAAAGFGAQMMVDESDDSDDAEGTSVGPISSRTDGELCVTLLPGTGFLPVPDVLIQTRAKRADEFVNDVRKAIAAQNDEFRRRDQKPPWRESKVLDTSLFWRQHDGMGGGFMTPFSMRPVLFLTKEKDAKDKERDMMVLAWTATSPESLVRRWLALPRASERRYLPSAGKTEGEAWVNWKHLYRWVHPYVDVAMNTASLDLLLPDADDLKDDLRDATITADLKYSGLTLNHRGPLPAGALLVPSLVAASLADDESSGSDLARERFASERLRILYHHAKLFRKDIGRWPVEIAELDGYVDFTGNPGLLQLKLSAKKQWNEWFKTMLEKTEPEEDEEDDELDLKDELYVINWMRDRWTLGFAPNTFEHLESLEIDQDGNIRRSPKQSSAERSETTASTKPAEPAMTAE